MKKVSRGITLFLLQNGFSFGYFFSSSVQDFGIQFVYYFSIPFLFHAYNIHTEMQSCESCELRWYMGISIHLLKRNEFPCNTNS